MNWLEQASILLITLALLPGLLRLLSGPGMPNRLVAAFILIMTGMVTLSSFAVVFGDEIFIDIALISGAFGLFGIIVTTRKIEGGRA